jgi:tRNA(Arg) A34 adenosine deaminase TadA
VPDHASFVRKTYELARASAAKGNHPFGALLVVDGEVRLV